jgi:hypothetical protein
MNCEVRGSVVLTIGACECVRTLVLSELRQWRRLLPVTFTSTARGEELKEAQRKGGGGLKIPPSLFGNPVLSLLP